MFFFFLNTFKISCIETFFDKLYSIVRPQLSRGNRPKFCDIVRQKELHYRDEEDRSESSEYNYYRQQGHLLTRWRKHSNARYPLFDSPFLQNSNTIDKFFKFDKYSLLILVHQSKLNNWWNNFENRIIDFLWYCYFLYRPKNSRKSR